MKPNLIICLMTDYGNHDRFPGIMKGVICTVDRQLKIVDITHEIRPYNISAAAYMLSDTLKFWPAGTSFVAVVDPGVGSKRKALAIETRSGHYIFCPDNGIATGVEEEYGFREVRVIDERKNHIPGIPPSPTFHGRDIFAYNAARIASGKTTLRDLGFLLGGSPERLTMEKAVVQDHRVAGTITHVEEPFGNLCTNIPGQLLKNKGWVPGQKIKISIHLPGKKSITEHAEFTETFSDVKPGKLLIYIDSSGRAGIARNMARVTEINLNPANGSIAVTFEKK